MKKRCLECARLLPLSDFRPNPKKAGGVGSICVACWHKYDQNTFAFDEDIEDDLSPEILKRRNRERMVLHSYGLTRRAFQDLADLSFRVCGICKAAKNPHGGRPLYVDHDHATGRVAACFAARAMSPLGSVATTRQKARKWLCTSIGTPNDAPEK